MAVRANVFNPTAAQLTNLATVDAVLQHLKENVAVDQGVGFAPIPQPMQNLVQKAADAVAEAKADLQAFWDGYISPNS